MWIINYIIFLLKNPKDVLIFQLILEKNTIFKSIRLIKANQTIFDC